MTERDDSRHWTHTQHVGGGLFVYSRALVHVVRAAGQPRPTSWWRRMARSVARKVSGLLKGAA